MIKEEIIAKISPSKEKAIFIADLVADRKAKNVVVLDVENVSSLCDYFVICSGDSTTQVKALSAEVMKIFKKSKTKIHHCEKDDSAHWILIDFFDVMLHIFLDEYRDYYDLEFLWKSAKKVNLPKKN